MKKNTKPKIGRPVKKVKLDQKENIENKIIFCFCCFTQIDFSKKLKNFLNDKYEIDY